MGNSESTLMNNILTRSALLDFGIQCGLFAIAAVLKTEKFYDLAGSGTFIFLALQSLRWGGHYYLRQKIQTGLVAAWGCRLGLYLFSRVMAAGQDRRFNKVRDNPKVFFFYWTVQAVWVFATLLPTLILNAESKDQVIGIRDYVGWGMWVVGFLMETVADRQKSVFRADPENAGNFITSGLWSICRHPNYFGEILLWTGLFISSSSVMSGRQYISALSPMFVWFLLSRVSGVPILERQGMRKWGNDPRYLEYVKKVPVLFPFFGGK
ncbi:uncharacterized protein LOC117124981 [Anneissia japonica]|uniref:uncharacterized protein LOC117124981 n=1 Tax=Anneissia japonica TaxID=1529436 RepID=UPI00142588B8|nr:uncharacterized protein LOC117124981 [Anneissia japonica]